MKKLGNKAELHSLTPCVKKEFGSESQLEIREEEERQDLFLELSGMK